MIWSDKKTVSLLIGGEELKCTFKVPSALEFENLVEEMQKSSGAKDSFAFCKFVLAIDGFANADECVNTPGTINIVRVVSKAIFDSASIGVDLKNA